MLTPPTTPNRLPSPPRTTWPLFLPKFYLNLAIIYAVLTVSYWSFIVFKLGPSHSNYNMYQHKLSKGWFFGLQMDNSDGQYSSFRDNIPILVGVMIIHFILKNGLILIQKRLSNGYQPVQGSDRHDMLINQQKVLSFVFSFIFLSALFGLSIIKIIVLVLFPFILSSFNPKGLVGPIITWIYCVGILFLNHAYQGYKFSHLSENLAWMDAINGVGLRWHITFNFTILRMISFSMDKYWANESGRNLRLEVIPNLIFSNIRLSVKIVHLRPRARKAAFKNLANQVNITFLITCFTSPMHLYTWLAQYYPSTTLLLKLIPQRNLFLQQTL
jgi:protein-cysteine N-palmitoyltransferase HHAT